MVIVGRDGWLYFSHEVTKAAVEKRGIATSLEIIDKFNRVMKRKGVTLAIAMVPLKVRIYPEHLPPGVSLSNDIITNYDRALSILKADGVEMIDLNSAFLSNKPKGGTDLPLYYPLDTHWSPVGALLAAETIAAAIENTPTLKEKISAVPPMKYKFTWLEASEAPQMPASMFDLVKHLPKASQNFPIQNVRQFRVSKQATSEGSLLGEVNRPDVTLMGSSYSAPWTKFPAALRYTLQRNILDIFVEAPHGSWYGMELYLRNEAFQTHRPKLIIWEMPERDLIAPPDYPFREARYQSDNDEWLLRVSALTEPVCLPSTTVAKFEKGNDVTGSGAALSSSGPNDFVQINFSRSSDKLDYLSANVRTTGSGNLMLEASGNGATRRFNAAVADDGKTHVFKFPLTGGGPGFNKVRIFPGKTKGFSMDALTVCRQSFDPTKL
jgi:alginate O-acetyltransferase complex protein AlgJ